MNYYNNIVLKLGSDVLVADRVLVAWWLSAHAVVLRTCSIVVSVWPVISVLLLSLHSLYLTHFHT